MSSLTSNYKPYNTYATSIKQICVYTHFSCIKPCIYFKILNTKTFLENHSNEPRQSSILTSLSIQTSVKNPNQVAI